MVRQMSLVDLAYDEIKSEIAAGSLAPGERILEAHIAERLGVSRPPLREALRILAARHILERTPRRGYRVIGLTDEDAGEIHSLRAVLEEFAAGLIAERFGDLDLGPLTEAAAAMWDRRRVGDGLGVVRASRDFHAAFVTLAGHRRLTQSYTTLMEQMELYVTRGLAAGDASDERLRDICARHQELADAIEAGEADRMFAALRAHRERHGSPSSAAS